MPYPSKRRLRTLVVQPPAKGGHAPGDVRDAFLEAITAFMEWKNGEPEPTVELREQQVPLSKLCGLLWNCRDILPGHAVTELEDCAAEVGSWTYSAAARWMKGQISQQADLTKATAGTTKD